MSVQPQVILDAGTLAGVNARISDNARRLAALEAARGAVSALDGSAIAPASITGTQIAADSITAGHIQANTINAGHMTANSIATASLQAGSVTAAIIDAGAINAGHISAGAVTANAIAANTITTVHIAAGTIQAGDIQSNTITATQLSAGAITTETIAAGAVTADKITTSTLSAITTNMGSMTAGTITGATIQTSVSGSRVVIDSLGLRGYASNGTTKVFEINTGSGIASFVGVATLDPTSVVPTRTLAGFIGGGNLIEDSSFESDDPSLPTGKFTRLNGVTAVKSTAVSLHGTKSLRVTRTSGTTPYVSLWTSDNAALMNYVKGRPIVFSAWVYVPAATSGLAAGALDRSLLASDYVVTYIDAPISTVPRDVWTRIVIKMTVAATSPNLELQLYNPFNTGVVYYDGVQLEIGDTATAYSPKPDEILYGSINTLQLGAGSVTANTVAAGAISAQKLSVTFGGANLVPNGRFDTWDTPLWSNLVIDGGFEAGISAGMYSYWGGTVPVWATAWSASGSRSLYMETTIMGVAGQNSASIKGPNTSVIPGSFSVIPTQVWSASAQVNIAERTGNTAVYLQMNFYNSAGTFLSATTGNVATALGVTKLTLDGAVVPASAAYMSFFLVANEGAPNPPTGKVRAYFDEVMLVKDARMAPDWTATSVPVQPGYWQTYDNAPSTGKMVTFGVPAAGPNAENIVRVKYTGATVPKGVMTQIRIEAKPNTSYVTSFYWRGNIGPWLAANTPFDLDFTWLQYPVPSTTTWQRYAVRWKHTANGQGGLGLGDWLYIYGLYSAVTAVMVDGSTYAPPFNTTGQYDLANVQKEASEVVTAFSPASGGAPGSVGNTQLSPDSVTTDKILARTIQAADIAAGTITATEIAATSITADRLNVTTLSAISGNMGTLTAGSITGATIQTASSGTRIVLDSTGFKQFLGASPTPSIHFKTDGSDTNVFTGSINARGIAFADNNDINAVSSAVQWLRSNGTSYASLSSASNIAAGSSLSSWRTESPAGAWAQVILEGYATHSHLTAVYKLAGSGTYSYDRIASTEGNSSFLRWGPTGTIGAGVGSPASGLRIYYGSFVMFHSGGYQQITVNLSFTWTGGHSAFYCQAVGHSDNTAFYVAWSAPTTSSAGVVAINSPPAQNVTVHIISLGTS